MKRLFYIIAGIARNRFGIQLVYLKRKGSLLGLTAIRAEKGFWYVGNVFDSNDIAYNIAVNGEIEKEDGILIEKILTFLIRSAKHISFYDIGANTGYYGIYAAWFAKKNGSEKMRVVSFEPLKEHVDCIRETAQLNRIEDRLTIYEILLGNRESKITMNVDGSGSSITEGFLPSKNYPTREVYMNTLDALIKKDHLPLPIFMKIDVEASEYDVLEGAAHTIQNSTPVIFMEVIKSLGTFTNSRYEETFLLMKKFGYESYTLEKGKLISASGIKPIDGPRMFLFLHQTAHTDLKKHLL